MGAGEAYFVDVLEVMMDEGSRRLGGGIVNKVRTTTYDIRVRACIICSILHTLLSLCHYARDDRLGVALRG